MRPPAGGKRRAGEALFASAALLALVVIFCTSTHWGRNYATFARKSWIVWSSGRSMPLEERRAMLYDSTYPVLRYLRENTPPDAVILLPPSQFIDDQFHGGRPSDEIALLASPSSVYNFIYPRVPVHWGDPSPWKDKVDFILVWRHWGLDRIAPGAAPTPENDTGLYRWPAGRKLSW